MPTVREISDYLNRRIPQEMKMDFDNVGLLAGSENTPVTKAVAALDITHDVIDEAISQGAQLVISHHPMFFQLKQVTDGSPRGSLICRLLQNGVSAICLHTNLDAIRGGVNDALAERLGVDVCGTLEGDFSACSGLEYGMGRYGTLQRPMSIKNFLAHVKQRLDCNGLRFYSAAGTVSRVALCGGSGGEFVQTAVDLGCDTLVTADVKYHQFLEAAQLGLNLIDADHFCTENVVVPVLAKMLSEGFPQVEVNISKSHRQTVQFF